MQPGGNFLNGRQNRPGNTFQRKQQLMVLWIQAARAGRVFTEMKKAPDLITEFGERAVVGGGQVLIRDAAKLYRSTMDCWVRLSGRETFDFPAVAFIAAISEAVVQAALPVLPEFDRVRLEAVASPGVG